MAKTVSLEDAATAFIILRDSGSYSGRELDVVLEAIRSAVGRSTAPAPDDDVEGERARPAKDLIDTIIKADADEAAAATAEHERHLKAKAAHRAGAKKTAKGS